MSSDPKKELIKEATKEFKHEELKIRKSRVYHNTELLMKNYIELKQHADGAIYKLNDDLNDSSSDLDYDQFYINSILKSKVRTAIMVQHIEMALEALKNNAVKNGYTNKYNILIDLFVYNKTYEELSFLYQCDPSTIRRWKNVILKKLSVLLFGSEGLFSTC